MASLSKPTNPLLTAIVPYNSSLPHISRKAYLEAVTNEVARRSLESAKYAGKHFSRIASNFSGRNFVDVTRTSIIPPKSLKADPCIDIEIFAATTGDEKPPILIFSHGLGQIGKYKPFLGELASQGYTVISLSHSSSAEDEAFTSEEQAEARTDELVAVMVNNIQYVINEVRSGALKIPGDPNKIILMGHSLGGAASIMISRIDPAISGCVNLDGSLKGNAKTDGLTQPLLIITGDYHDLIHELEQHTEESDRKDAKRMSRYHEEYETLCRNSRYPKKPVEIRKAIHMDFTDQPFREYLVGEKSLSEALRVHTLVSCEMFKFLRFCFSK